MLGYEPQTVPEQLDGSATACLYSRSDISLTESPGFPRWSRIKDGSFSVPVFWDYNLLGSLLISIYCLYVRVHIKVSLDNHGNYVLPGTGISTFFNPILGGLRWPKRSAGNRLKMLDGGRFTTDYGLKYLIPFKTSVSAGRSKSNTRP